MSSMPQNVSPSGRREVMGGLAKGLEVLRTFSRAKPHMTLSEIAARAGLPAATARRCLNTLEELGYVARNGRQFLLRPPVLEIGAVYLDSMGIQNLTQTKLEELALATGGSAAAASWRISWMPRSAKPVGHTAAVTAIDTASRR